MIGFLCGSVRHGCVVTSCGTGYRVDTVDALIEGDQVELLIETISRDGDVRLFGFSTQAQLDAFRAIVKAPGVGPAAALSVLRALSLEELARALRDKDAAAIQKAKGVGAKAAGAIVTAVDAKVLDGITPAAAPSTPKAQGTGDDLLDALCGLGYREPEARRALEGLEGEDADVLSRAIERLAEVAVR